MEGEGRGDRGLGEYFDEMSCQVVMDGFLRPKICGNLTFVELFDESFEVYLLLENGFVNLSDVFFVNTFLVSFE